MRKLDCPRKGLHEFQATEGWKFFFHHHQLLEILNAKMRIKKKRNVVLVPLHRVHAEATNHTGEYERRAVADMTLIHFC